jgi:DNA mismatch repair protein MutL
MNKIKILPEILANQIAAGEVVERPASVVKELIENSLDAGAKRIKVEIESGGRRLMRVSDDGCGMSREDAITCFERHATSKIRTLEDLSRIQTLGFRGEALASIASVAKVELITKAEEDEVATRVLIEGGRLIDVNQAARPIGTTVTVRDLFFNTPARRKFMRAEATENYHLTAVLQHYALAYPEVSFVLINQGREVLNLAPAKNLKERIFQIFGAELVENLLPVEGGNEFLAKVSGFISAPHERRSGRDYQFFFVNRRFVRDRILQSAVSEAFRSVLPQGTYPVAFVFLQVPYEEIDVNVHPAKIEVRFRRAEAVKETVTQVIRQSLSLFKNLIEPKETKGLDTKRTEAKVLSISKNFQAFESQSFQLFKESPNLLYALYTSKTSFTEESEKPSETPVSSSDFEQIAISRRENLEDTEQLRNVEISISEQHQPIEKKEAIFSESSGGIEISCQQESNKRMQTAQENSESVISAVEQVQKEIILETPPALNLANATASATAVEPMQGFKVPLPSVANKLKQIEPERLQAGKIVPLGQIRDSYIVAVDDQGLLLIDQHVAHERILFEKFRKSRTRIEIQNLLIPETVDLSPAEMEIFASIEEELERFGFRVMRLSGRTVAIKAVPADVPPSEVRSLFLELLSAASSEESPKATAFRENLMNEIAARMACKAAVKVNMKLTVEKMQWLIENLLVADSPATCPHGRPIILRLTIKDIERGFHRT